MAGSPPIRSDAGVDAEPPPAPAGRILVSVVIPALNAASTLPLVLEPLRQLPRDWEVIVVDDHSTDATVEVARRFGAHVTPSAGSGSCSAARNTGVVAARGDIVVFLDADIVSTPENMARAVERLMASGASGLFGVYDRGDHLGNVVARFKNYWIRHSTLTAPRPLDWINTSLAVVWRRDVMRVGGLDDALTTSRGGCDLDLGRRLVEHCGPVVADPSVEIRHLKRFNFWRLLTNDFRRSRGWLRLAFERRRLRGAVRRWGLANVGPSFSWGVIDAALGVALLLVAPLWPPSGLAAAATFVLHPALNRRFLADAARERVRGWPLFPIILWVDQCVCAAGLAVELASWAAPGRSARSQIGLRAGLAHREGD